MGESGELLQKRLLQGNVMLGSSAGTVHKQRQGTGKATILQSDNLALKDFLMQDAADKKAKGEVAAAKQKAVGDAMKAITDFNPERWLRHEQEIKDRMNQWVSTGSQLLQQGVNPNSSLDERSTAWRKQKAEIEAMAKASMQMKDMFTATRAKIDGSEPDKYDSDTLINMKSYFETPLEKIVTEGILPPPMLQRKPGLNLQKTWAGLTNDLYDRNGKKPLDESGKWDFVRASMANDPEMNESTMSYFSNLPAVEQQRYQDRAKTTGRSVNELVNYDFMERYSPAKEPFNLDAWIQKGVDAIDVPYAEYSDPNKFSKFVDSKEFKRIADQKAQTLLVDPDGLYEYQKLFPMKSGESEGDYRARAVADLSKRMRDMKATSTKSGLTDKGGEGKDIAVSAEKWLSHVKSGDPSLTSRAANYLFESKGVLGNMNVANSEVLETRQMPWHPAANDPSKIGMKWLRLSLEGAPSLKQVKERLMENGIMSDEVTYQSEGTTAEITIPITDDTENALLRMHDKAFKTGSRAYDAEPLQWSADLKAQGTPVQQKPKSRF